MKGILEGGTVSSGSEDDSGIGTLLNIFSSKLIISFALRIFKRTDGKSESEPSVRSVTLIASKATTPRFFPAGFLQAGHN